MRMNSKSSNARRALRPAAAALLLAASATVAGCVGGVSTNRSLYSEKQPVVERQTYVFDVATTGSGVPFSEQQRLLDWFDAMDLGHGDKVSVDTAAASLSAREDLMALAMREGIIMGDAAPVTEGAVAPGIARVVVSRTVASVPGCPDWSADSDANPNNATSPGYGCAVNGNLAAMVADPEDLLRGQRGTGETVVMSSTKAINSYREQEPTGNGGLPETESGGD